MDNSSQRKILRVSPEWETPKLAGEITSALAGNGPILGFGEITSGFAPAEVAVVIGTSGTTGNAKEVALTSHAITSSAKASNEFLGARPGDTWSLLLPLTHIAAVNVIVRALELGSTPIDLRSIKGDYPDSSFTAIVPTQLFRALNGDTKLLKHLQNVKAVLIGGAALSPGLRKQAETAGIKIVTTYGMTETCGGCVYDGQALTGVEFDVKNGKVRLKGNVLATNYLNAPWNLDYGWFETSDLGEVIDGKLVVLGRSDDVIVSGGENISLGAVENSLAIAFPQLQTAAFSYNDPQWGQSLQLAVVGEITDEAISLHLEKDLGPAAKPKGIHRMSSLPLRGIGKIDREALTKEFNRE
jgi:O-succinylbenzoic acid--CoA ligase